jgi:hypothetical protein
MKNKLLSIFGAITLIAYLLFAGSTIAQPAPGPVGGGPDFSKATQVLGVTAAELSAAIGGPPPDFAGAAEKFGVSVEELLAVLPAPPASDIPEGYTADDFMQPE